LTGGATSETKRLSLCQQLSVTHPRVPASTSPTGLLEVAVCEVGGDVPSNVSRFCLLLQLSIEQAQTVAEQVEMKAKVVQSEVKAVTARHKKALEDRECELLWKVEKIRQVKAKSLFLQVEKLRQSLSKLESTISAVQQVLEEGRALDILLARDRMLAQVQELKTIRGLLQPQEDDRIMFTPPDQALYL
ncbi:mCG117986, isoform CRA_c, partial [Mus musculus]